MVFNGVNIIMIKLAKFTLHTSIFIFVLSLILMKYANNDYIGLLIFNMSILIYTTYILMYNIIKNRFNYYRIIAFIAVYFVIFINLIKLLINVIK